MKRFVGLFLLFFTAALFTKAAPLPVFIGSTTDYLSNSGPAIILVLSNRVVVTHLRGNRMVTYEGDVRVMGNLSASNGITISNLVGSGSFLAINPSGVLYRTNAAGGGGGDVTQEQLLSVSNAVQSYDVKTVANGNLGQLPDELNAGTYNGVAMVNGDRILLFGTGTGEDGIYVIGPTPTTNAPEYIASPPRVVRVTQGNYVGSTFWTTDYGTHLQDGFVVTATALSLPVNGPALVIGTTNIVQTLHNLYLSIANSSNSVAQRQGGQGLLSNLVAGVAQILTNQSLKATSQPLQVMNAAGTVLISVPHNSTALDFPQGLTAASAIVDGRDVIAEIDALLTALIETNGLIRTNGLFVGPTTHGSTTNIAEDLGLGHNLDHWYLSTGLGPFNRRYLFENDDPIFTETLNTTVGAFTYGLTDETIAQPILSYDSTSQEWASWGTHWFMTNHLTVYGDLSVTGSVFGLAFLANSGGPGYLYLQGTNSGAFLLNLAPLAFGTNEFRMDIRNPAADQYLAFHSVTTHGPTNIIVTTNRTLSAGGGTLTGSGTANRVAYWSGASSLTSDAGLTYDSGTDTLTAGSYSGATFNYTGNGSIGGNLDLSGILNISFPASAPGQEVFTYHEDSSLLFVLKTGGSMELAGGLTLAQQSPSTLLGLNSSKNVTNVTISGGGASYSGDTLTVTRVGVFRTLYVDAGAMVARTTAGAAANTEELPTNDVMVDQFLFDDTTSEGVQFKVAMPDEWNLGIVKVKFYWSTDSATTSHTVVWGIRGRAASNDDAMDGTWGTQVTVSDDVLAADDMHITAATSSITVGGSPALADMIWFEVVRLPADAADDHVGDARLLGVAIQYQESTTEPSAW